MNTNKADNKKIQSLPKGWAWTRLGEVAEINSGGNAPQGSHYFSNGKYPFVRVQHFDGTFDYVTRWNLINDVAVRDYRLRLFPKDSIIFPKSGASIRLEKRAILPIDSYVVSHLCVLIANRKKVEFRYLFYLLKILKFSQDSSGTTLPYLNISEIGKRKIPLPPLPEQKKIAAVLSCVQEAKEKTEVVIEAARGLKKSLMKHLFTYGVCRVSELESVRVKETEIGLVPEKWEVVKIEDVAKNRTETVDPTNEDIIYVGLEHITPGDIKLTNFGHSSDVRSSKSKFYKDDILYAKLRPYLDKGVLAEFEGVCSTDIIVIQPDKKKVEPAYLVYFTHQPIFLDFATKSMTGVNHPRTHWTSLKEFKIPLPPLPVQQKIADILSAVDKKIEAEENKKKALEELFKTLLSSLMTARIRVNDLEV